MLVQRVALPTVRVDSWTVLGDDDVPVEPVERYLAYLTDVDRSPNTVRAYAYDLKDYWTFLVHRGLDWREVRLEDLGEYVVWLQMPPSGRKGQIAVLPSVQPHVGASTVNRKLSALSAFYAHQLRHGVDVGDLLTTLQPPGRRGGWKPFLHHINPGRRQPRRTISLKVPKKLPRVLDACAVDGCRYGLHSHGMCQRHWRQWKRCGSPPMSAWPTSTAPLPVPSPLPEVCRINYCDLWVRGTSTFCTGHDGRWKALGRPGTEDFTASYEESGPGGSEHIDLRRLPMQLRLEVQYALQCRHDEATKKIRPAWAQRLVNALADAKIRSLLDEPEEFWRTFRGPTGNWATGWGTFLLGARRRVEELVYGRGWEAEYPRPVWRLRNLGIVHLHTSTVTFEKISQSWLRDLVKRWARWRLSGGIGAGTVRAGVRMVARFSAFLPAEVTGLAQVDRALLERYLADLHAAMGGRSTHNAHISNLNTFLRTIRVHRWDETLPGNAAFVPEDYPTPPPLLPRSVAEHVMAQLEDPANLARWQDSARRLITLVLMRCGLRITDAINLPLDPVVHDAEGAPYLRYFNHKMKREALVPIDEELEQQLRDHQRRILEEWPEGVSVLFPRADANLRGDRPISTSGYRISLAEWLQLCETRDELGRPAHITPHQFRHTLGTRLINKDVPQEVVRQILDHTSAQMTAHYARLSDTTVRRHWEKARKVNAQGETVALDPAGPLAEAAWAKQRLSRATRALPNGYCGLPVVQSCPHANSCLTCPVFITTAEFLPQHRAQRQQTLQIISAAEARGQKRLVEMNRQVADNLEKIITSLEDDGQPDTGEAAADAS